MSVFTSVDTDQLNDFLKNYPAGSLQSFKGIEAGITNSNFFVNTDTDRYVLTIVEQESHTDVEWFMQLLAYLHTRNIPCALPLKSSSGHYTQTLANKPATLVECLQGADKTSVTDNDCESIGKVLANFHVSCRDYSLKRTDSRGAAWREETALKVRGRLDAKNKNLLDEQMQSGYAELCDTLPASVIHADLFRDNVLFANDSISGIIDFYYACNGCMLYDLAITFNDWCRNDATDTDISKARALFKGYESVRPLEAAEKTAWPAIVSCAALRFWLSRLADLHFPPDALMTYTKDPGPFQSMLSEPSCSYVEITT